MNRNMLIPVPMKRDAIDGTALVGHILDITYPVAAEDIVELFLESTERSLGDGYPIGIDLDPALGKEEYWLTITEHEGFIAASGREGIHHALESLRQLIYIHGMAVPCQSIHDKPRYEWRGFMIDCCRHFFPVDYLKKLIDAASLYHLSVFHWHLTEDQAWRIEIKKYPVLTEKGSWRWANDKWFHSDNEGFYTQEEIKDVVEYAAKRCITVVPELEMPGHASALLRCMPELGCTGGPYFVESHHGVMEDILCAGNDKVFEVLSDILDEYCELFPSEYIHIGGDEAPTKRWEECPKCRKRAEEENLEVKDLQYWFSKKVIEMVKAKGRTPIGWDEIANPILKGQDLDQDLALMLWRSKDALRTALDNGHRVVLSRWDDGAYLSNRQREDMFEPGAGGCSTLKRVYSIETSFPELEHTDLILGGQANLWSEKILWPMYATYLLFPRLLALSEAFWSEEGNKDYEDFKRRLSPMKEELKKIGLTVDFSNYT